MIRSSSMKIDVYGQSVHVSEAYLGKDAMAAGMEIHRRIMALDHRLPPETKRLIKIGKFHSGTVGNAVAEYTEIRGTLRAYEDDLYFSLREQIYAICKHVEEETGCTVKVDIGEGYPAVWNPEDLYEQVCKLAPIRYMPKPSMGAEDFSWYQRYLPGLFIFMGVGEAPAAHSTDFDFDDSVLVHGADYFQTLAQQF
jgi:hippurate hydrolase